MPDMYRVIVTGQRDWYCPLLAESIIAGLVAKHDDSEVVVIIEGGADGVDRAFREMTDRYPVGHETFNAQWKLHGKAAGPRRNAEMIAAGADLCIAVHKNILESKGTKDCVIQAHAAGIPCWLVQADGKPKRLTPDHVAAIRGDWEPPAEDEPVVHTPGEESGEAPPPGRRLTGMICSRGKGGGCKPFSVSITEATDGPGNVAGVVQRAMRGEPTEGDTLDHKGRPPLIDGPPLFGQPPVSFWAHALGSIGQYNGRFKGDHPAAPEPIQWEEVLLHLAFVAMNAKLHGRDITDEKIKYREWVDTLANVHRFSKGGASFLEEQLTHYLDSALLRAEERLVEPRAEPPAPEPPEERYANRTGKPARSKRPPAPSKETATAKLDASARAKPKPKRKGKT